MICSFYLFIRFLIVSAMALQVGVTFRSFTEFQDRLKCFQRDNNTQFTLRGSEKLVETDVLYQTFTYSVLRYVCKQGHRLHKSEGRQVRPHQRSFKVGCPVMLNVRLHRRNGQAYLKVTKLYLKHRNHEVSVKVFYQYPEQRRSREVETHTVAPMEAAEGKKIMEGCHEDKNAEKGHGGPDENECTSIIEDLMRKGGYGEVSQDHNGHFSFCVFMTSAMKSLLRQFPECFIMDCTYKVSKYLHPLLTIMIIDGEGRGMPVFHAFLAKEDTFIIKSCLKIFARQFDSRETKCFMINKDMAEIAAIAAVFPNVPVNLCPFHVAQAVDRRLRELGRGSAEVALVKDIFMKQVFTESEEEFDHLSGKISEIVPEAVTQYFLANWWSKKHLWAACCSTNAVMLNATTNALQSYHGKINQTINTKLNLANTMQALLTFNETKKELQRQQLIASNSHVYDCSDSDTVSRSITKSVTSFGAGIVKKELAQSYATAYNLSVTHTEGTFDVSYKERHHLCTAVSCTCSTFGHMKLPCRHIFLVRRHQGLVAFEESLIPDQFKRSYIKPLNKNLTDSSTVEGRHHRARSICDKIANFLANVGEVELSEKIVELENLLDRWSQDISALEPLSAPAREHS